jgi:hypothetical protein
MGSSNLTVVSTLFGEGPIESYPASDPRDSSDLGTPVQLYAPVPYTGAGIANFTESVLPGSGLDCGAAAMLSNNSSMPALMLNCTPSQAGTYQVWLNSTDRAGAAAWSTALFTVFSDVSASPPTATGGAGVGPGESLVNATVSFLSAPQSGTGIYGNYSWEGLPLDACTGLNRSVAQCTFRAAAHLFVRYNVSDSNGGSASSAFLAYSVIVSTLVVGTVVTSQPAGDVGQSVTFNATVAGGTGSYSTYVWQGLPPGCPSSASGEVSCSLQAAGQYSVSLSVQDSLGEVARSPLREFVVYPTLTVGAVQAAPERLDVGQSTELSASAAGGSPNLTFTWSDLPGGCVPSNSSSMECAPTASGEFAVGLEVRDDLGSAVEAAAITVSVRPALAIEEFVASPSPVAPGGELNLTVLVGGGTAPYSFQYAGLPLGCASRDAESFDCQPNATGSFVVSVTVTDTVGASSVKNVGVLVTVPASVPGSTNPTPPVWLVGALAGVVIVAVATGVLLLRRQRNRARSTGAPD